MHAYSQIMKKATPQAGIFNTNTAADVHPADAVASPQLLQCRIFVGIHRDFGIRCAVCCLNLGDRESPGLIAPQVFSEVFS